MIYICTRDSECEHTTQTVIGYLSNTIHLLLPQFY